MAVDAPGIRSAWSEIPSPGSVENAFERFTSARMERILAVVVAVGSLIIGTQGFVAAWGNFAQADPAMLIMIGVVFIPLLGMLVACVLGRGVRFASGTFATVYLLALAVWPVVDPAGSEAHSQPWIFFLVNIGVVAAMMAFPLSWQIVFAIGIPLVYGYVRLVQGSFASGYWISTAFDVSFTLILGIVIIALGWMFRSVASGVDDARGRAVASYATAAASTAAEEERITMAALMHDSVLAALIAAERAESERARDLAVAMSQEALTRLANAEASISQEGSDDPVATAQIVVELRRALSELGADAVVEERGGIGLIPGRAARALVLAARQAIGNAMTHAHGRGLHIVAQAHGEEGITVTVSDTGAGFDTDNVPEDRLGIRASIVARMAAVAGSGTVESGSSGTVVVLRWERS